jgi:hypothetical protein
VLKVIAILLALAGLSFFLEGCDRPGSGGHMMGSGMMGGGMMGQMPSDNTNQTLPEQQSEGAQLLQRYCGQCHVPPAPAAHAAPEWPQVVNRMKQHMVTQGKALPDSKQLQEITDYLQRHAG